MANSWIMPVGHLEPEFTILGVVPKDVAKVVSWRCQKEGITNVCACQKAN